MPPKKKRQQSLGGVDHLCFFVADLVCSAFTEQTRPPLVSTIAEIKVTRISHVDPCSANCTEDC